MSSAGQIRLKFQTDLDFSPQAQSKLTATFNVISLKLNSENQRDTTIHTSNERWWQRSSAHAGTSREERYYRSCGWITVTQCSSDYLSLAVIITHTSVVLNQLRGEIKTSRKIDETKRRSQRTDAWRRWLRKYACALIQTQIMMWKSDYRLVDIKYRRHTNLSCSNTMKLVMLTLSL